MADAEKDPLWIRVTVAIVLHLLWFGAGFGGTLFFLFRSHISRMNERAFPIFLVALGVGAVGAIFGPAIFNRERLRGRGAMDEVKRNSRPPKPKR